MSEPVKKKIILHLCADTGTDSKPYQDDSNYEVRLIGSAIGIENYNVDEPIYGIIANPVCLEFSTARSNGKARNPKDGMFLVNECFRIIDQAWNYPGSVLKFWVIENPARGVLHKFIGQPVAKYEPWHYGSPWTKQTALWGEGWVMPERIYTKWEDVPKNDKLYTRPGRGKPSLAFLHKSSQRLIPEFDCFKQVDSDMEFRSMNSQKFAKAFKEANL